MNILSVREELTQLPLTLPRGLAERLGCKGNEKVVLIYWDMEMESLWGIGCRPEVELNHAAWTEYLGSPDVAPVVEQYGLDSCGPASHFAALDLEAGKFYVGPISRIGKLLRAIEKEEPRQC